MFQAGWRSQSMVRLDLGLRIAVNEYDYVVLANVDNSEPGFKINIVSLSDLEYQLKNVEERDNSYWIEFSSAPTVNGLNPTGRDFKIRETQKPIEVPVVADNPNQVRFIEPVPSNKTPVAPTFIDFAEERLGLGYDYGAVGGPSFNTEIVETSDGSTSRNTLHHLPLGRWQLGDRMVTESEADKLTEVSYLKSFHSSRQGSYQGFRYKDWNDYQAIHQIIGIGDGVTTQWQLKKAYKAGDAVAYRPITKPVFGTVIIYANGETTEAASEPGGEGWTVYHSTGVISNSEPLGLGVVLSASFEFDVPVWFETDEIGFSLQGYEPESGDSIYRLESVFVVEKPIPLTVPWFLTPPLKINTELDLGIVYETTERRSFETLSVKLKSEYVKRSVLQEKSKLLFDLGARVYDRIELDRLLAYFWNARGQTYRFPLKLRQERYLGWFDSNQLSIKFEVANEIDSFYSISGVKLELIPKTDTILNTLDKDTFLYIFIDTSGSMNNSIPAIEDAIAQFKVLLQDKIYGSESATNAKVIRVNFSDERWLKLFTDYPEDKAVYLIWINEAAPTYHQGSYTPPTASYFEDLQSFISSYNERVKFKAEIYSITFSSPAFAEFQSHLIAAHQGIEGYSPALVDYNVNINLDVNPDTSAAQYFQQFSET